MIIKKINPANIILLGILWCASLALLIVALTDIVGKNFFQPYRLIIGIGFLGVSAFLRNWYNKVR